MCLIDGDDRAVGLLDRIADLEMTGADPVAVWLCAARRLGPERGVGLHLDVEGVLGGRPRLEVQAEDRTRQRLLLSVVGRADLEVTPIQPVLPDLIWSMNIVLFSNRNPDYHSLPAGVNGIKISALLNLIEPIIHESGYIYMRKSFSSNGSNHYAPIYNIRPIMDATGLDTSDLALLKATADELQTKYADQAFPCDDRITLSAADSGAVSYVAIQGKGTVPGITPLRANIRRALIEHHP